MTVHQHDPASSSPGATLSRAEIDQFHRQGYLGPYTAIPESEMDEVRAAVEETVLTTDGPVPGDPFQSRFLDAPVIFDLATNPAVLDRVDDLIGPDVVLWRSNIFNKPAGHPEEIPWHQDYKYWPIEPPLNVSAWIAIDAATVENSCVQLVPGSHREIVPHVAAAAAGAVGQNFTLAADPTAVDIDAAISMELRPGQFFLFVERLLHHSAPNRSDRRRLGVAARFTVPFVRIEHDDVFPGHRAILVRGRDVHGFNRYASPPQPR